MLLHVEMEDATACCTAAATSNAPGAFDPVHMVVLWLLVVDVSATEEFVTDNEEEEFPDELYKLLETSLILICGSTCEMNPPVVVR